MSMEKHNGETPDTGKVDRTTERIRRILRWMLVLTIAHVVGFICYSLFCAGMINTSVYYGDGRANGIAMLFSLVFMALCCIYDAMDRARDSSLRMEFVKAVRTEGFSFRKYYLEELKFQIYKPVVFALYQFPMMIFCTMFRYSHTRQIIIEKFYAVESGFYAVIAFAPLACLLSALYLAALMASARFVVLKRWRDELL